MGNHCMLGEFIARRRKELGITQKELADRIGVSDKAVSKWETLAANPDISLLVPLADTLQTSVEALLKGGSLETEKSDGFPQSIRYDKRDKARHILLIVSACIVGFACLLWALCLALACGQSAEDRVARIVTFAILTVSFSALFFFLVRKVSQSAETVDAFFTNMREADGFLVYWNLSREEKKDIRKSLRKHLFFPTVTALCLHCAMLVFFVLSVLYEHKAFVVCLLIGYAAAVVLTCVIGVLREKWLLRNKIVASKRQLKRILRK